MMNAVRKCFKYPVIAMLIVCMLTNGLSLSFSGEVFAHELDHVYQKLPADPATHLEMHRNNIAKEGADLDAATHICLHAAGQFQPFFFNAFTNGEKQRRLLNSDSSKSKFPNCMVV